MNGRFEEELKIEEKIENLICDQPKIVRDYYNSFMDETYNTKYLYIKHIIKFVEYLEQYMGINFNDENSIQRIKMVDINNHIKTFTYNHKIQEKQKNTNSYIANKISAIRNFFEFLIDNDIIKENPSLRVKIPKDKRIHEITSLTEEEIHILEANIINGVGSKRAISCQRNWVYRDLSIILLGITTGLRISAICNMNIADISFQEGTIKVIEKGGVEKYVYVPKTVLDMLNKWIEKRMCLMCGNEQTDAVFISNQCKRISTSTVRRMLDKYTYNIDKKITPHKLRSTAATNLYEKTGDIYLVADVLGHKNLQNTRRYAKMSDDKRIAAAKILEDLL